ncbi:hypothetical protein [Parabacteroides goldsteinii]|uniref:Uncharacterized protein n=1 Tax=Parabacteroides goldsteinii DSM 19448 = WAL 12034 TaxID=927665 RepID=A0A0F5IQ37_9BACT|nr:hypothetical protein [Parabacteroides goldsteinii]KKB47641.1 hypothetical protein HMPREF1535_04498 [Parabacteroides goldsteinii DSM 19448 = WAL 12034]
MNIFLETESFLILLKYKELCESSIFVIEEDTLNIKKASSPIDISQGKVILSIELLGINFAQELEKADLASKTDIFFYSIQMDLINSHL